MGLAIHFIVIMSIASAKVLVYGAVYSKYHLQDYCGRTINVDCPYTSTASAGTLILEPLKNNKLVEGCIVDVKTRIDCGIYYYETFRFYLNIRVSYINTDATVKVYDMTRVQTLEKSWDGRYMSQYYNPSSVGQILSYGATQEPHIRIVYDNTGGSTQAGHNIIIDYVILESRSTSYNTYCSALRGYVKDDYICDTTDDRVNCPSNFEDSTTTMYPAQGRQSCVLLSSGEIAGVVVGSIAFVVMVIAVVAVCCRRQARVRTPNTTVAFTNNPHSSAANVTILGMPPHVAEQQYAPRQPQHPIAIGPPPPYPTQSYAAPNEAPKY